MLQYMDLHSRPAHNRAAFSIEGGIPMQLLYNNIPALLKLRLNWVVWGIRAAGNIRDSPLKSPFNPASLLSGKPSQAKAGVPETWATFQNAVECVNRGLAQGIGYEFDGSVYGVDLDHVLDENGALTPQAQEIVGNLDSYTEISPSGTGIHIFVIAPGADIMRHRKKDFFVEIYKEGRYFTVTGNIKDGKGLCGKEKNGTQERVCAF